MSAPDEELGYRAAMLSALVASMPQALLAVSPERKVLASNPRFEQIWRLAPGTIKVGDDSPALLAECRAQVVDPDAFEAGIRWGHEHCDEEQRLDVPLADGRIIEGYAAPITDDSGAYRGRIWFLTDATDRRAAETERAILLDRLQTAQRSQTFLLEAAAVLARASGYVETLERLAAVAVPTLGDLCLIDVVGEDGRLRRSAARHADPGRQPLVDELRRNYPPDPDGHHPSVAVIRTGRSSWSATMDDEFLRATSRDEHHFRLTKDLGFTSYMSVPLISDGAALGAVTLVSAGSGRRFGPDDLALAEELADQVAAVVAKERRYEAEHRTAHILQARLLPPTLPDVPGVEVAVRYLPGTQGAEVGGDFYDMVVVPSGRVGLMIGDVAGHDAGAAALMGQLRSAARALAGQVRGPGELIDALQWSWDLLGFDRIATAAFGRLDPSTGELVLASAGHPPPLVVAPAHTRFLPVDVSSPLGSPATKVSEWNGVLEPGAVLLLYTDGMVEERDVGLGEGMARLARIAAAGPARPEPMCERLMRGLAEHRTDDAAILAVQIPPR